jgi:hypothetical protein
MTAGPQNSKCRLALESIADRYRIIMPAGYQTDWTTAFPMAPKSLFDDVGPLALVGRRLGK